MKNLLLIIRWLVGLLFIFSGLIKANDPLGFSYKMQEFFDVWGWHFLNEYALSFAIGMNLFEVLAGVAVIIGWRMRLFSWLLLLLIIFFTFLTAYVLFSGKIKACGCFGDCLPLTPVQTFVKDIGLLIMILFLFFNEKKIKAYSSPRAALIRLVSSAVIIMALQLYVLKHLPFLDCLPYKKGKDILQQMKIPAGALPDSFVINYQYKKNGKEVEFDANHFPADFDSTYEYVNRYDKLVRKGTAEAGIVDFSLQTLSGNDSTQAVLNTPRYILAMVNSFSNYKDWQEQFASFAGSCKEKNISLFIVTSQTTEAQDKLGKYGSAILKCDGTVIKTAARVNPTYLFMDHALILDKISYVDENKIDHALHSPNFNLKAENK